MSNDLRRGRHVVYNLHVHLVFVAKYRRKVFTKEILDDMRGIFESVCTDFEAQLVEFDGEDDHVHLLVNYPPKVSISKLVNSIKVLLIQSNKIILSFQNNKTLLSN